jgi:integrase/recombinase XerD
MITAPDAPRARSKAPHLWSAATIRSAQQAYGSFLKYVSDHWSSNDVTPEAVALWAEDMLSRMTALSAGNRVRDLWYALRLMYPERDWRWLGEDAASLLSEATPTREKQSSMADVKEIRRAAISRMRRAETRPKTSTTALEFQDGFIMLLLAYRPIRRRNLAETRLGVNLIVDDAFNSGRLIYEKTKSGRYYDVVLPEVVLHWLRRLVEVYRPILIGPRTTDEAWLSRQGTPLSADQLRRRICKATERELGKRISLHRFRDCLATTVSEIAPEHIEDAARVLGHRDMPAHRQRTPQRLPAIEFYRQVSGSTHAAGKLADILQQYRVSPPAKKRTVS